jgi:putative NADPH-quinone reductase
MKKILIIQGHPDNSEQHYCHVLAEKYSSAANSAGHKVKQVIVADLALPILTSKKDFDAGEPIESVKSVQEDILWADHLVVIYPIWLGDMPAQLKGFFEQVFRPNFAFSEASPGADYKKLMSGKSARIFVTMGMPAIVYRWFYKAHAVKVMKRNILSFCGFKPVRFKLIGRAHAGNEAQLHVELGKAAHLGRLAQ